MRLFVAVWPSRQAVGTLQRLRRPEMAGVRWTSEKQWHVTLRFLGDVDDPTPVAVALQRGLHQMAPTDVVADRRARRFGPSAVGVPVHGLDAVAAAVADATVEWCGKLPPTFKGHLTLARCRGRVPAAALSIGLPSLHWTVSEVALVRSHLDPAGARYETVRTVTLGE